MGQMVTKVKDPAVRISGTCAGAEPTCSLRVTGSVKAPASLADLDAAIQKVRAALKGGNGKVDQGAQAEINKLRTLLDKAEITGNRAAADAADLRAMVALLEQRVKDAEAKVQAEDRAHRIGQQKTVEVIPFLAKGTVDERIMELIAEKEQVISQAVDGLTVDRALAESVTNRLLTDLLATVRMGQEIEPPPRYISEDDVETLQGYRQEDPKGLPPAVNWVGGKARLAVHIVGLIPPHRVYVEPFSGMASVLLRKPPSVREVLNDKSPDVVRFLRSLKRPPLCRVTIGERTFRQLKAQRGNLSPCGFMSLQSCSFGGKGKEFASDANGCTARPLYHRNRPLYAERMKGVVVTQGDWEKTVHDEDSPDTFFYLDPPYLGAASGLAYARGDIEPERLARILQKVKGKFLMTVNDLAAWRGAFSWAQIRPFFSYYTVAKASNTIKGRQLFISNYPLPLVLLHRGGRP